MLFIGSDRTKSVDRDMASMVNSASGYYDAFGDFLDEALLPNYPYLHQVIKSEEGYYLKFYSFYELDKADFNTAVRVIREYLAKMTSEHWDWQHRDYVQELLAWQEKGFLTWVEPHDWEHRSRMKDIAAWQAKARRVWEDIAQPFVVLDDRYDANLAECKN